MNYYLMYLLCFFAGFLCCLLMCCPAFLKLSDQMEEIRSERNTFYDNAIEWQTKIVLAAKQLRGIRDSINHSKIEQETYKSDNDRQLLLIRRQVEDIEDGMFFDTHCGYTVNQDPKRGVSAVSKMIPWPREKRTDDHWFFASGLTAFDEFKAETAKAAKRPEIDRTSLDCDADE